MENINNIDRKILFELDFNSAAPLSLIAKRLKISRQSLSHRIFVLQNKGVLGSSIGIFDSAVVGFFWYRIIFKLINADKKQKTDFFSYLKTNKNTLWVGELGGDADCIANFAAKNTSEFNLIYEDLIFKFGKIIKELVVLPYVDVYDLNRAYFCPTVSGRQEFYHSMKLNENLILDKINKDIIKEYCKGKISSNVKVGYSLNVSDNTIRNRVKEMKKNNFLLGFRQFVNPSRYGYVVNFLFLELNNCDEISEKKLYDYARNNKNVIYITKHIGKWRIGLEIETTSTYEFYSIFSEIKSVFKDIITDFDHFLLIKDHKIRYFPE